MLYSYFIGKQITSRIFYFDGIDFRFGLIDLDIFDILILFVKRNANLLIFFCFCASEHYLGEIDPVNRNQFNKNDNLDN